MHFPPGDTLYLSKSAHDILFVVGIHEAEVVPSDLAFFIPKLNNLKRPVTLSGGVTGTLDSLAFDGLT